MILDDFLVHTSKGYYCKYGDFYIDASQAVLNNVVSHAHADHARAGSINVYATAATSDLMKYRYKAQAAKNFFVHAFGEQFEIKQVKISFHSAAHIIGSSQILMEYQGIKYLYSGDIKLQPDETCEDFQFVKADVLITETTFAKKDFKHPRVEDEILKLSEHDLPVIVGSYVLGKAQRLNNLISKLLPDTSVSIHYDVLAYHKLYEKYGFDVGKYQLLDKKMLKNKQKGIYIVPPLTYQSYKVLYPYVFAFASGWDNLQENSLKLFVSDHVDWFDLLNYIRQTEAKQIWAIHGDSKDIINYFSNTDILVRNINVS
jgi:putative mRNA 3-end processing factor